jgi:hypothetical protein
MAFSDFDSRALTLTQPIQEDWQEQAKLDHYRDRDHVVQRLIAEFGHKAADQKIRNFINLDRKPFSVIAFHNRFFEQARIAYVMGAFYPALAGTCALGERILNHLILILREDFKSTPEYKRVYKKKSFDDWNVAIDTLEAWDVLLPKAAENFRTLRQMRNDSLHFRRETDDNDEPLALSAIKCLQEIIGEQFSGFGPQPWFITDIPGEIYIKKGWENRPFIREIYIPNGHLVGPNHEIKELSPSLSIVDVQDEEGCCEITDEEFSSLRLTFNNNQQHRQTHEK